MACSPTTHRPIVAVVIGLCTTPRTRNAVIIESFQSIPRVCFSANVAWSPTTHRPIVAVVAGTCTTRRPRNAVMAVSSAFTQPAVFTDNLLKHTLSLKANNVTVFLASLRF